MSLVKSALKEIDSESQQIKENFEEQKESSTSATKCDSDDLLLLLEDFNQ